MDREQRKAVHGSQSAFYQGAVITSSRTGCLRNILIDSFGIKETFPEELAILGALNEELHESKLKEQNIKHYREVKIKYPILGLESVEFSGRADFILKLENMKLVHELKSASSKNTYSKIFKKGEYKPENLAQLIAYMISIKNPYGRLIYSFYKKSEDQKWEHKEDRIFDVEIAKQGEITINGADTEFLIQDQLKHRYQAARVLEEKRVAERPYKWDTNWTSPCKWCVFSAACTQWDIGRITSLDRFLDLCEECVKHKEKANDVHN